MALALRERTFELLKSKPDQRFKAREIAEWIHTNYPDETSDKMSRSTFIDTENALLAQLVAESRCKPTAMAVAVPEFAYHRRASAAVLLD